MTEPPALLFDLDGTLIDSVYQHVLAWQEALDAFGIDLSVWKIHRRIGMSGGLFVTAIQRETGGALKADTDAVPQLLEALRPDLSGRLYTAWRNVPPATTPTPIPNLHTANLHTANLHTE